jgi:hypothetical protein
VAGTRGTFNYSFRTRNGANTQMRINCDSDVISLEINGQINFEPNESNVGRLVDANIPVSRVTRGQTMRARTVTLRYTGLLPDGRVNPIAVVPVLTITRYEQYVPGAVGTYQGLPVEVLTQNPGVPN